MTPELCEEPDHWKLSTDDKIYYLTRFGHELRVAIEENPHFGIAYVGTEEELHKLQKRLLTLPDFDLIETALALNDAIAIEHPHTDLESCIGRLTIIHPFYLLAYGGLGRELELRGGILVLLVHASETDALSIDMLLEDFQ